MTEFTVYKTLLDAVVADGNGTGYPCGHLKRFSIQLEITVAGKNATVTVETTNAPLSVADGDAQWELLATLAADGDYTSSAVTYGRIRGVVASWVAGAVTLHLVGVQEA